MNATNAVAVDEQLALALQNSSTSAPAVDRFLSRRSSTVVDSAEAFELRRLPDLTRGAGVDSLPLPKIEQPMPPKLSRPMSFTADRHSNMTPPAVTACNHHWRAESPDIVRATSRCVYCNRLKVF